MKKIFIFLPLILLSTLNSCNNTIKVNTLFGINNVNKREIKSIKCNELKSLLDNKATFAFVQKTSKCECSKTFESIVDKYVKETGLILYSINYEEAKELEDKFYFLENGPTFHVVIKGENNKKLEMAYSLQTQDFFSKYDSFKSYMNNHFSSPSLMYVDETELDALYNGDKKFVIYFSKSDCSECSILSNTLFNEFGQVDLNMKTIYVLDYKDYDEKSFNESRIKYGLSETTNPEWGYGKGALPMIYTIIPSKDKEYKDMVDQGFCFGNDILDSSYKVSKSYYTNDRVKKIEYTSISSQINREYKKENTIVDGYGNILLDSATNIATYKPIFVDFINYINKAFLD